MTFRGRFPSATARAIERLSIFGDVFKRASKDSVCDLVVLCRSNDRLGIKVRGSGSSDVDLRDTRWSSRENIDYWFISAAGNEYLIPGKVIGDRQAIRVDDRFAPYRLQPLGGDR